uniref:G-patch domain-containing protein n=1 Tax=Tetraselmis sp. GSL018 TaxID=582737 RepID=A0A061SA30_9CHLO
MEGLEELESQLEQQLSEQRSSLRDVSSALELNFDLEMSEVQAALESGISETEHALLEIKRARLLEGLQSHPTPGKESRVRTSAQDAFETLESNEKTACFVGQDCIFRSIDGLWYDGVVRDTSGDLVKLDFAAPTRLHQLELAEVPAALVRPSARSAAARRPSEGDEVLAMLPDGSGLWGRAEVVGVDSPSNTAEVVFRTGGGSREATVPLDRVSARLGAWRSAEDAVGSGTDRDSAASASASGSEEDEEDEGADSGVAEEAALHEGLGRAALALASSRGSANAAAAVGPQTDVAHFAEWEGHTRGIASKMMAAMGYVRGRGLGADGSGRALPLEVVQLRAGKGLGADGGRVPEGQGRRRKRKRGGLRGKQKKHADRRRREKAARDERELRAEKATGTPGVFAFINSALGESEEV